MKLEDLTTPLPRAVREVHGEILKGTGQAPDITVRDSGRRYRLSVESTRVRMQIDYKLTGRRWVWAASQLYVDGVQRPIVATPQLFYRLWHDPDGDGYKRADPADDPALEPYPLEDAPPELRQFVESLRARFGNLDADGGPDVAPTLEIGRSGDAPVIRIVRGTAVLSVWLKQMGAMWLPHALRLVRDGYDHTPVAGTTFEDAIAIFLGDLTGPRSAPAGASKVGAAHAPARLTGVEVRKQSVMRI